MGLSAADIIKAGGKLPPELMTEAKRRPKYGNTKPTVDGIIFDSQKEADEYCRLKIEKKAGLIKGFERQVEFILHPAFMRGRRTYRAIKVKVDFVVTELDNSKTIREVKSDPTRTKAYMIKKKLLLDKYPEYQYIEVL